MPLHISLSNPEKGSVRIFGRPKKRGLREVFQGLVWTLFRCLHTIRTETSQNIYHTHRSGRLTNSKLKVTKRIADILRFPRAEKVWKWRPLFACRRSIFTSNHPHPLFQPSLIKALPENSSTQPLKYHKID